MDKNKKLFPQRLWELIHDEKYNFCLRWSPDGHRVYLNRNDFETHYLKTPNNQFHTQKAISFVRQMNMYGFRKVDDCYYENDNFKRNCPHLLKNMVRRHSNKGVYLTEHSLPVRAHQQQQQQIDRDRSIQSIYYQTNDNSSTARANIDLDRQQRSNSNSSTASLLNNPIAAATAINLSNNSINRHSPLTSTLYHRLAALNFGQNEVNGHLLQHQAGPNAVSLMAATSPQPQLSPSPEQLQPQQPHFNMPITPQQTLAILHEILVRSIR